MSEFWMGVLAIPALIVLVGVALVTFKLCLRAASALAVGLVTINGSPEKRPNRALAAGITYGAKRLWFLTAGDIAFVVIVGHDNAAAVKATGKLERMERVDIRQFTAPTPRPTGGETTDDKSSDERGSGR